MGSLETGKGDKEDGHGFEGTLSRDKLLTDPGEAKEFGFPIDEIVPENWGGTIRSRLINLQFKLIFFKLACMRRSYALI